MLEVLVLVSFWESDNMGASKQLSSDLKTKIINCYESYLSRLFFPTVRSVLQKWNAPGTELRMAMDKPQTTSSEQQENLVADGWVDLHNPVHFAPGKAYWTGDWVAWGM